LILSNQFRILAAVDSESRENSLQHLEALESGYEAHYSWMTDRFDSGLSATETREIVDILQMHSDILHAFEKAASSATLELSDVMFGGFDGNNESQQMGYADYFLFKLGRFSSLHEMIKINGLNSHAPMLPTYRLMLPIWKQIMQKNQITHKYELSMQQLEAIVFAPPWRKKAS
jgi:uncharacterized protein